MNRNDQKVQITIRNWEKHQRVMKSNKQQRDWVALSTRLMHDPDFFNLTIEQRYLWVMLLCHAGAVGPVFKLSPSDARVMFKLRRSADFSVLQKQGFIELHTGQTGQDRQDRTDTIAPSGAEGPKAACRFADFYSAYPIRRGRKKAEEHWRRKKLDRIADELIADVTHRKAADPQWVKDGGKYIPWPQKYLNQELWKDEIPQGGTDGLTDGMRKSLRNLEELRGELN